MTGLLTTGLLTVICKGTELLPPLFTQLTVYTPCAVATDGTPEIAPVGLNVSPAGNAGDTLNTPLPPLFVGAPIEAETPTVKM